MVPEIEGVKYSKKQTIECYKATFLNTLKNPYMLLYYH